LRSAALASVGVAHASAAATHAGAVDAIEWRERTIASALPSTAKVLVQAGLFDTRAVKALRAKQQVSGTLLEASNERLRALDRTRSLTAVAELTAVSIVWGGSG
jgi:hypothetical protein